LNWGAFTTVCLCVAVHAKHPNGVYRAGAVGVDDFPLESLGVAEHKKLIVCC